MSSELQPPSLNVPTPSESAEKVMAEAPLEEEHKLIAPVEVHDVQSLRGGRAEGTVSHDRQAANSEDLAKQASAEIIAHFDKYADNWFHEYQLRLERLKKAIMDDVDVEHLRALVEESLVAFGKMFKEKARAVDADVLHVMAGLWRTPLEVSLSWNGGMRPTTLFHLIHQMMSAQIDKGLALLLSEGEGLANLTGKQLEMLSSMQLATTRDENVLSDESASLQMNLAALPFLGLDGEIKEDPDAYADRIKAAMSERLVSLKQLVHQGDKLRVETITRVLGILTQQQQVEVLVGISELELALRRLGEIAKAELL